MSNVEFVIVGQGLAGTMLAFEMLEQNLSFKIISSPTKSKASLVAAGMINPLVFKRLTKSWMVDDLLPVLEERYQTLETELKQRFYFRKQILKPLSEQEMLLWQSKMILPEFQKYIHKVSVGKVSKNMVDAFGYGIVDGSGYLDLAVFLEAAANYFLQQGLLIEADLHGKIYDNPELGFAINELHANKLIFCEGYHLKNNPLFDFVKMNPAKGEVLLIHSPNLPEEFILNKQVFVLPVGNHRFKVGSTYEWEDLDETPTEKGKASIVQRLDNLISVDYEIEQHWAGVRPTIADRRAVSGKHPVHPNIYAFNGLGTKGVMLAPYLAKEMCRFLTDEKYILSQEINLARFL